MNFPAEILSGIPAWSRAIVSWPMEQSVPLGATYDVYSDSGTGTIDFTAPVNADPIDAWPANSSKAGLGLGALGTLALGFGGGGYGLGLGALGMGPLGIGTALASFTTPLMPDSQVLFAVLARDAAGNELASTTTIASVTLAGTPRPPTNLTVQSYDAAGDRLVLTWTKSPDDVAIADTDDTDVLAACMADDEE